MTPEELKKLNEVYDFMNKLKSSTTIPFDVGEAFKVRSSIKAEASTKTAASETVTTGVGGGDTVANEMDGFIKLFVNGVPRNVPYYD